MRRRSRSTGRCTASIDPYQGSCPVARYLFHDDGTGARSEDSSAARLARPRFPGGLAVSDFPAAPDLSQRDRRRVRPFIPETRQVLAITSGLGQIVLFAGLTAALWRAN